MPQPTLSDVHVDRALTDLSVRFTQSADRFIANTVFPTVRSQYKSDLYYVYDRSYWFRSDAQLRGPASESAGSGYEFTTDNFNTKVVAIHKDVDDQTKNNADSPITIDRDATDFVTQQLLQYQEQDWVTQHFTTGVWGTDLVGGTNFTQWDDYASSDPISDMREAVLSIERTTALTPNTLVLGPDVWNKLQDHPDYLDRIKGGATTGTPAMFQTNLLASMIGVDRVLIPRAVKNASAEGETASYDFHFGKSALLMHVASSPGLNTPTAGYTFRWTGMFGTGNNGIRVKRFRMEHIASDRIEGETAYDHKVVSPELGYFWSAAVA